MIGLALSALAVGAAPLALPPVAAPSLYHQVAASRAAPVVWSYCGGPVGRLGPVLAAIERLLRPKLALGCWNALLLEAFGSGGV